MLERLEPEQPLPPQPEPLARAVWDSYGSLVRGLWGPVYRDDDQRREFLRTGFWVGRLPDSLTSQLVSELDLAERYDWTTCDFVPGYEHNKSVRPEQLERLNESQRHIRLESIMPRITEVIHTIYDDVSRCLGAPWRVVNLRALETPVTEDPVGPYDWHGDHFPCDVVKVLVYLTSVGPDLGTTVLIDRQGREQVVAGPPGTWLLFLPSELLHRGVLPREERRLMLEIALAPSPWPDRRPLSLGTNSIYPLQPWFMLGPARIAAAKVERIRAGLERRREALPKRISAWLTERPALKGRLVRGVNRVQGVRALNIGGGPDFCEFGWANLEGAESHVNRTGFRFTHECRFPFSDDSVPLVYSSHCLEHLDDATVEQVLREARRVLRPGGRLILKLPDYDEALRAWRERERGFFRQELWGIEQITHTWGARGVPIDYDHCAAMIFCGYWNDAYGQHFDRDIRDDAAAYHGPPALSSEELRELLEDPDTSPHSLVVKLRAAVLREETERVHFNHQNAWSRVELRDLLASAGFRVQTFDADEITGSQPEIPGLNEMREISLYCSAE